MCPPSRFTLALCAVLTAAGAGAAEPRDVGKESGADRRRSQESRPGSASLDLRYRYEHVEQAGFQDPARASLLRTRVTLQTPSRHAVHGLLQIDNVAAIGAKDYDSTENGRDAFPIIADPRGTDINQALLAYEREAVVARVGRQRILLGDMRFIGRKPWRNNEQTYDGARLQWNPPGSLRADFSYVRQVNRIFGPDDGSNPARWRGDSVFLRSVWTPAARQTLAAFAYAIDVDPQAGFAPGKTVNNSSDTLGVEYRTRIAGFDLRAAVATQADAGQSRLSYRATYYVVEAAVPWRGLRFGAAYEVLGSDNGVGVSTPLANGHRYQGWADQFLSTPGEGLRDSWLSVAGDIGPVALTARYHDFRAEASSLAFAEELDLQARWAISPRLTATLKAALFDGKVPDRYPDTDKAWLMLEFSL